MLKFAEFANVGDVIKAYDFKPMEGRPDCFMTGIVTAKGPIYVDRDFGDGVIRNVYMYDGYTIKIIGADEDTREARIGDTGYVPFEVDFMEYDGRIELVATKEELDAINDALNEEAWEVLENA